MASELDTFMDAVELHRQRDALEAALRGFVATCDSMTSRPGDPMIGIELVHHWTGAKMLLAQFDKAKS